MQGIVVIKEDFSNLENRSRVTEEILAVFSDEPSKTSHLQASKFIEGMKPLKLYLGWDGEVYPKIKIKTIPFNKN